MRITESRIRQIIRQELLREATRSGMLRFSTGSEQGSESQIPYEYAQRPDNRVTIENLEPGSTVTVTLDNRRGSVREVLAQFKDLPTGKHELMGPEDMGFATYGLFHVYIKMQTRNGNTLTETILINRAPPASGFELVVGRRV